MKPFPHHYRVRASATEQSRVYLDSSGLPSVVSALPPEFGGPGDSWSPETLLVAAVSDCFILTFRAIAKASNLAWTEMACDATGRVERPDGVTRFSAIDLQIRLEISNTADLEKARKLIEKTEKSCLVSNSLAITPTIHLELTALSERQIA